MAQNKKDVIVVGAGPAGLVAAICLNREGLNVVLHERQARVGGEPGWHPSVHGTPVDDPGLSTKGAERSHSLDSVSTGPDGPVWRERPPGV